ncbi:hypothetical protein N7510_003197 [Penicillium lagena]|uniref:uncharacterized protein n=1 Tax=Penicillium lagena TaxID=94218 RepID=UPI00254146AD|nr:uncharacterized protein N7510_003197 [Penicillium lagena]KAJ5619213.1 hypothetical protein N7510_003197 [Penicillium lagena]
MPALFCPSVRGALRWTLRGSIRIRVFTTLTRRVPRTRRACGANPSRVPDDQDVIHEPLRSSLRLTTTEMNLHWAPEGLALGLICAWLIAYRHRRISLGTALLL